MASEVFIWNFSCFRAEEESAEFVYNDSSFQVKLRETEIASYNIPFFVRVLQDGKSLVDLSFVIVAVDSESQKIFAYEQLHYNSNPDRPNRSIGWETRHRRSLDKNYLKKSDRGCWNVRIRIWTGDLELEEVDDLKWLFMRKSLKETDITPCATLQLEPPGTLEENYDEPFEKEENEPQRVIQKNSARKDDVILSPSSSLSEVKTSFGCKSTHTVISQEFPNKESKITTHVAEEERSIAALEEKPDNWEEFVSFVASELRQLKSPAERICMKRDILKCLVAASARSSEC